MQRIKLKPKNQPDSFLTQRMSRVMAAKLIGLTPARISQLEAEGAIHAVGGQFALGKFGLDFRRHVEGRSSRIADDAKIRQLKIEQMERRAAEDEGRLVPIDWVKEQELTLCGQLLSHLVSVPARFTRDKKDRQRLEAMLDAGRDEFCNSIGRLKGPAKRKAPA